MAATFVISDGVRRAKAAMLAGHTMIWATIDGEPEVRVAVASLLSPKRFIDVTTPRELRRWTEVIEGMDREPDLLPPISITAGNSGVPIGKLIIVGLPGR